MFIKMLVFATLLSTLSAHASSAQTLTCKGSGDSLGATATILVNKLFVGHIVRVNLSLKSQTAKVSGFFRTDDEVAGVLVGEGILSEKEAAIRIEDHGTVTRVSLHSADRKIDKGYGLNLVCSRK